MPNNPYNTYVTESNSANYGQAAASAATGFAGIYGDIRDIIESQRGIKTSVTQDQVGAYERPTYGLTDELQRLKGLRTDEVGEGMIGRGFLQGGLAGASAGTAIAPGVGTLIGGAAGALAGGIGSIFGKKKAQGVHDEKVRELTANIREGQEEFNLANELFYDMSAQRDIYNTLQRRRMDPYNIPSIKSMLS